MSTTTPNFDDVDLKNSGVYAGHLSEVNKTKRVIATEDIFNENGVLLVCGGWQTKSTVTKHLQRAAMNGQIPDEIKVYQSEPMVE